jgi:hypothetical protein
MPDQPLREAEKDSRSVTATPRKAEAVGQFLRHLGVAVVFDLAAGQVRALGMDAEDRLGVLLVGDADVDTRHDLGHDLPGLLAAPEFLAVVKVAGDQHPFALAFSAPSRAARAALSESAGVMPVKWKAEAPSKMASQSNSAGSISAMALLARS